MNSVLKNIEFLLTCHDCVIVPGLGAFISSWQPARFDFNTGHIVPPKRSITFNRELNVSDGLLINSVSRSLGLTYNNAAQKVGDFVSIFYKELAENKEISLGRIGSLRENTKNEIYFTPFTGYGFQPLEGWFKPISKNDFTKNVDTGVCDEPVCEEINKTYKIPNFVRAAIGAAAAILIALVVSTPVAVDNTYNATTVVPITPPTRVSLPQVPVEEVISTENDENAVAPIQVEEKSVQTSVKADEPPVSYVSEPRMEEDDEYVLVVASLSSRADASTFVDTYIGKTGLELHITENAGRYRVYAATGQTAGQAMSQASNPNISRHFKQVWATRR